MKTKKIVLSKKLSLNKNTISKLDNRQMGHIVGGDSDNCWSLYTPCYMTYECHTWHPAC